MAISRKKVWPQCLPCATAPIKYITENGFSIIRVGDLDATVRSCCSDCRFVVQRDDGPRREVHVSFDRDLTAEIRMRRRAPLADGSLFWLVCAESCLANYLWQYDDLPPNDRLVINQLPPDELMLAVHWRDQD